ncbi:MAG: glycosyltransferase [Bacteroidales bacterium]|uniref:glycosyltransferase n=1 Tax=Porphyromonas sp. TaxID=1924944 RepID=UPI0029774242|nr:glycosyltransferase [Porphyromonas sp.]MDD7438332.1 glycosyltransferase [Bacteroidales bacterium]MDY3066757.1 glycosyltransferase [Porphyromonas sp.]
MSVYKNDTLDFLKVAIDSILEQTYGDFKFYIIQDGPVSEDVTSYLTSIADSRVFLRSRILNKGLAVSLNELLSEVLINDDCEFVARMDADDYSMPTRFNIQINYLKDHPEIDIVGSYISESSNPLHESGVIVKYPLSHKDCKSLFGKRHPLAHVSVVFRKSFFDKAGLYPTDTLRDEDGMMWLNGFLTGCTFANISKVLVLVRVSESFYKRRSSKQKAKQDHLNRLHIIKSLHLPKVNYLYAYLRYALFRFAPPFLLKVAYRIR